MIYKIIIGKQEIQIDEDEKRFFVQNQDKRFIELKSGDLINTAFVQGIIIEEDLSKQENRNLMALLPKGTLSEKEIEEYKDNYFQKNKKQLRVVSDILQNHKLKLLK